MWQVTHLGAPKKPASKNDTIHQRSTTTVKNGSNAERCFRVTLKVIVPQTLRPAVPQKKRKQSGREARQAGAAPASYDSDINLLEIVDEPEGRGPGRSSSVALAGDATTTHTALARRQQVQCYVARISSSSKRGSYRRVGMIAVERRSHVTNQGELVC